MRVPDEVLKCVGFVLYKRNGNFEIAGTAFFVLLPTSSKEEFPDLAYTYAVTAKHVIVRCKEKGEDGKVYIRVNVMPGVPDPPGLLETPSDRWTEHPTESDRVDVAILPILPPADKIDFKAIPTKMAVTDQVITMEGIGVGDETFITGLFAAYSVQLRRNAPIVRIGNIASMREESVPTRVFGIVAAYLI